MRGNRFMAAVKLAYGPWLRSLVRPWLRLGLPAPSALAGYWLALKPTRKPREPGGGIRIARELERWPAIRQAERKCAPGLSQEPPRLTRYEPDAGPVGSVTDPVG